MDINQINQIKNHWYAYIYDQQEDQTDDIECMLSVIGSESVKILEVCCGTGRILVPLARAGYDVTGFDMDEDMMSMIPSKAVNVPNLRFYKADAVTDDWGSGYDVVVLAGNIMINIVTSGDYMEAQQLFIRKAAGALKSGGYAYLCFDLRAHPEKVFNSIGEQVYFEGVDDAGVYGRYIGCGGTFNRETRMTTGKRRTEITLPNGEKHIFENPSVKHIPTLEQVHGWLCDAGFTVEQEYGSFSRDPISEATHRAVIYAKKR